MLTRIMAWLRPRRMLSTREAELAREVARVNALAAHLVTLYQRAGLPAPLDARLIALHRPLAVTA